MTRIVVAGSPRAGKSTLASRLGIARVRSADEVMGLGWSEASELIAGSWFDEPGPWVIEGVAAGRALRKWLAANPEGRPCDRLLVLERPCEALSKGQATMGKGVQTVLNEIRGELERRGVVVEYP
ncbi:MAG: hypothetical protein M3547_05370 [Acidobacteriota bacterium]|nr:hypothetical protein [Acidobacteriota bacterium]